STRSSPCEPRSWQRGQPMTSGPSGKVPPHSRQASQARPSSKFEVPSSKLGFPCCVFTLPLPLCDYPRPAPCAKPLGTAKRHLEPGTALLGLQLERHAVA